MNKLLYYDDIALIAGYTECDSRSELDTSVKLGEYTFKSPIIPANMKCSIDFKLAEWLGNNGYFYVLHRFYTADEIYDWVKKVDDSDIEYVSISIGVNDSDKELIDRLSHDNLIPEYITVDIAHGHCLKMKNMLGYIKEKMPETFIIAGNVMTRQAVEDLASWGADCAKIGIGQGKVCFLGDTLVNTIDGYKQIKDIDVGDRVMTHTGEIKTVIDFIEKYSDDMIEVNGNVCTKNHKFYVINKSDVSIVDDDNIHEYAYWLEACKITNEHFLLSIDQNPLQK